MIADGILLRKRTIGATASTATGLTAWSGATGTQRQRERDAEEIAKAYNVTSCLCCISMIFYIAR